MQITFPDITNAEIDEARRDAEFWTKAYHDVYTEGKLEAMVIDIEHNKNSLMRVVAVLLAKGIISIEELDNI